MLTRSTTTGDARTQVTQRNATQVLASYCEPAFSLVPSRSTRTRTRTHKGKEHLVDIETKLGPKTSYPVLVECNLRAR